MVSSEDSHSQSNSNVIKNYGTMKERLPETTNLNKISPISEHTPAERWYDRSASLEHTAPWESQLSQRREKSCPRKQHVHKNSTFVPSRTEETHYIDECQGTSPVLHRGEKGWSCGLTAYLDGHQRELGCRSASERFESHHIYIIS